MNERGSGCTPLATCRTWTAGRATHPAARSRSPIMRPTGRGADDNRGGVGVHADGFARSKGHDVGERSGTAQGVTRRGFLARSVAVGVGAMALPLLAACSASAPPAAQGSGSSPTSAPSAAAAPPQAAPSPQPSATAAPAGVATRPIGVALGKLPTYQPIQGPAPDLPGSADGLVSHGWNKYPKNLFQSVKTPPGSGGEVHVTLETSLLSVFLLVLFFAWFVVFLVL